MNPTRPRPRRSLRSEAIALSAVLAVPLVLALLFPYAALSPSPASAGPAARPSAVCAFVELEEDLEATALAATRTAWHVNQEGVARLRIEMFSDELKGEDYGPVIGVDSRTRALRSGSIPYEPEGLPSDLRAASPVVLDMPDLPGRPVPFPKEELLKLD